jgi:AcrR family transcriptional regulator
MFIYLDSHRTMAREIGSIAASKGALDGLVKSEWTIHYSVMAQRPKEEIRSRILTHATATFAERGFVGTTIAEIARRAGVSTGNVYSYLPSKEALFAEVVPPAVLAELRTLLAERLAAATHTTTFGSARSRAGASTTTAAPHTLASTRLLSFVVAHRLPVGIALVRAQGSPSPHATFTESLLGQLLVAAETWAQTASFGPSPRPGAVTIDAHAAFALRRIYGDLLRGTGELLLAFADEAALRRAVTDLDAYHLAGLQGFFLHLADLAVSREATVAQWSRS